LRPRRPSVPTAKGCIEPAELRELRAGRRIESPNGSCHGSSHDHAGAGGKDREGAIRRSAGDGAPGLLAGLRSAPEEAAARARDARSHAPAAKLSMRSSDRKTPGRIAQVMCAPSCPHGLGLANNSYGGHWPGRWPRGFLARRLWTSLGKLVGRRTDLIASRSVHDQSS
jgi:hypothetical protein